MSAYINIPGPGTALSTYLLRAINQAGITDPAYWFDDFTQGATQAGPNQYISYATNGTHDIMVAGMAGGICRESTTGTLGSQVGFNGAGTIASDLKTGRWYQAHRMAVPTAVDAQCNAAIGQYNQASTLSIMGGVFGANSTGFYSFQYDGDRAGSFITSAVAVNTAFHIFEMWGVGDNILHARIDNGAEQTATLTSAVTSTHIFTNTKNGTTAANRIMDIDWFLFVGTRL